MKLTYAMATAALLSAGYPSIAWASSSVTTTINAHVDTFCKISSSDDRKIDVVNGMAEIGAVSEICNTPAGYDVTARFMNLRGGVLNVAGLGYAIDPTGTSVRHSDQPHVQTLNWRLASAELIQPDVPVFMQVTITPL
jgi:hypothetical protein